MKASYGEGLANHTSLESCGNCSNVVAEALTEGSAGGLLSFEINLNNKGPGEKLHDRGVARDGGPIVMKSGYFDEVAGGAVRATP